MAHLVSLAPVPQNEVPLHVLSAGLDWVSASTKTGLKASLVQTMAAAWLRSQANAGFEAAPFDWNGYAGRRIEGISYGERADGTFVRLSGEMARVHGHVLLGYATHASRLDVQVTLQENNRAIDWADLVSTSVQRDPRVSTGRIAATHVADNQGGHTFYLGRRASDRFFRVYNKYAESKGTWPAGSWRFEVEYKGRRVESWHERLKNEPWSAQRAIEIVKAAFKSYGFELPVQNTGAPFRDTLVRPQTTDEKRLEYLGTSVRPLVQRLRECYGVDTLRRILDLNDTPATEEVPTPDQQA